MADDFGCFEANPAILRGKLYPYRQDMTEERIASDLAEYSREGMLELWSENERPFGFFVAWGRHQRIREDGVGEDGQPTRKRFKSARKTPVPPSVRAFATLAAYYAAEADRQFAARARERAATAGECPALLGDELTTDSAVGSGTCQEVPGTCRALPAAGAGAGADAVKNQKEIVSELASDPDGGLGEEKAAQDELPQRTPSSGERVAGDEGSNEPAGAKPAPHGAGTRGVETSPAASAVGQSESPEGGPPAPGAAANAASNQVEKRDMGGEEDHHQPPLVLDLTEIPDEEAALARAELEQRLKAGYGKKYATSLRISRPEYREETVNLWVGFVRDLGRETVVEACIDAAGDYWRRTSGDPVGSLRWFVTDALPRVRRQVATGGT